MRLQIEVLDGPQKGKRITLQKGLLIGRKTEQLDIGDQMMAPQHGVVDSDNKNAWNFECLAPALARVGSVEMARVSLLLGLVFHLGQTGFKVVEKTSLGIEAWDTNLVDWLKENPGHPKQTDFLFFLNPISLAFVQGPQYEQFSTLSYGPRILGHGSLDIHLVDPSCPPQVARFFQVADRCYVENLCGERATINSNSFDQHPIKDGDRLKVNSTIIELSMIK